MLIPVAHRPITVLMPRKSPTFFPLSILLAFGSGVLWFVWDVYGYGNSCTNNNLIGAQPPSLGDAAGFVFASAIAVAVRAAKGRGRSSWAVAGLGLLAGALTALAISASEIAFGISRHCYS